MVAQGKTIQTGGIWTPQGFKPFLEEKGNGVARLPKVLIGIPSRGVIPHAFVEVMNAALIGNGELFQGNFAHAKFHVPDNARNTFVETALEGDYDYLFFMDTDMTFPKGCLAMMLRHTTQIKEDNPFVLGGIYCNRGGDFRWHVYKWVQEEEGWHSLKFPLNQGIRKVDAIGTGCMLIDMNVFKILEWPWFEYEYRMFKGNRDRLSEDMAFCQKCMNAGIPIYADSDIKCGHFLSAQVMPTDEGGYEIITMSGEVL